MAFVFGSYVKGQATLESDFDVAVYFKPSGRAIEWEENKNYPQENEIWPAEYFIKFTMDFFWKIKQRSASLSDIDRR